MDKNKDLIEHLTRTVEYLELLISDLSNPKVESFSSAYCFALRVDYTTRIVIQKYRIEELETELQQYKAYVNDLTATIQKSICKDFLPNIETSTE